MLALINSYITTTQKNSTVVATREKPEEVAQPLFEQRQIETPADFLGTKKVSYLKTFLELDSTNSGNPKVQNFLYKQEGFFSRLWAGEESLDELLENRTALGVVTGYYNDYKDNPSTIARRILKERARELYKQAEAQAKQFYNKGESVHPRKRKVNPIETNESPSRKNHIWDTRNFTLGEPIGDLVFDSPLQQVQLPTTAFKVNNPESLGYYLLRYNDKGELIRQPGLQLNSKNLTITPMGNKWPVNKLIYLRLSATTYLPNSGSPNNFGVEDQLNTYFTLFIKGSKKNNNPTVVASSVAAAATAVLALFGAYKYKTRETPVVHPLPLNDMQGPPPPRPSTPPPPQPDRDLELAIPPDVLEDDPIVTIAKEDLMCPIGSEVFKDPVIAGDGNAYERKHLQDWYDRGYRTCPNNPNAKLVNPKTLPTAFFIKDVANTAREKAKQED